MSERDFLAARFEEYRPRLRAVAYRMLGSISEAEDAVQESWLRLDRTRATDVGNLQAWLTTVVGRVSLDMLRSRRARREDYPGEELPEPVVTLTWEGPEEQAELADSVGLALLVVLESLTPAERLAFVLHDMFGVPFEEIGSILERTPASARQLASRARRRVRGEVPHAERDIGRQRQVVDAFLAAAREGDFEALVGLLDPEVVLRVDTGKLAGRREPVLGAREVASELISRGAPFAPHARPAVVNGAAGAIVVIRGRLSGVVGFSVVEGRIAEIDIVADPEKLSALDLSI